MYCKHHYDSHVFLLYNIPKSACPTVHREYWCEPPTRPNHSERGERTTFNIYLPTSEKEVIEDKKPSREVVKGEGTILLVDDEEMITDVGEQLLEKLGYSVTTVASGEEAVDYLKDNATDLLISDMIMNPGIDGYETYKRILTLHPNQKAIIVSGFSETERVKEAQRLGAGAYVKKPFLMEKIGIAVRDKLDK